MDRLESIVDWRVRAAHYDKADPGAALDMIAVQLNDPARLFPQAPPIPPERRLVPRRMPNPRAPTFRLSEQQQRWMFATGVVIEAAKAWCLHGEPIAISAQGLASFGGRAALDNDPLVVDPDNQAARTAVLAAEQAMREEFSGEAGPQQVDDDDEHDNGAGIVRDGGRGVRDNGPEVREQHQQQLEVMDAIGIDRDGGRDARANAQDGARDAQAARPVGSGRDLAGTRPSRSTQSPGILYQGRCQQARQDEARGATYLLARAIALDVVARCVAAAGSTYAPGDTVTEPAAPTVPGNDEAASPARCIIDVRKLTAPSSSRWHPP
ncbi:Reverse transcriptase domain-containing protein [Plasmodiophora brassicae]